MFNIGPQELLIVLAVALIVVGPKRLPELARTIGRGMNEFRKVQDEVRDMVKFDLSSDPEPPEPTPHRSRRDPEPGSDDEGAIAVTDNGGPVPAIDVVAEPVTESASTDPPSGDPPE